MWWWTTRINVWDKYDALSLGFQHTLSQVKKWKRMKHKINQETCLPYLECWKPKLSTLYLHLFVLNVNSRSLPSYIHEHLGVICQGMPWCVVDLCRPNTIARMWTHADVMPPHPTTLPMHLLHMPDTIYLLLLFICFPCSVLLPVWTNIWIWQASVI